MKKTVKVLLIIIALLLLSSCTKRVCSKNGDCVLYETLNKELTSIPLSEKGSVESQGYTQYNRKDAEAECFKGVCAIKKGNRLLSNEGITLE